MSLSSTARATLTGPTAGFSNPGTPAHYAPIPALEPTHQVLGLRFDLDQRRVQGTLTLTLSARTQDAYTLRLDAVGFEQVQLSGEQGVELEWRYDGESIFVQLKQPVAIGEQVQISLSWTVTDPIAGLRFSGAGQDEGRFVASDHETSRARYWLPCVDHPLVRTTAEIQLHHDSALRAVAAGELVSTTPQQDGTTTTSWSLAQRTPAYLFCVLVGDLTELQDGDFQGAPIAYFAPKPATQEQLRLSFARTGEMLEYLTHKLDRPLPWPKYFQFVAEGIGGAMENVSLVSWDSAWLMDERYRQEMGWLVDSVNLHEMSHTWFGDRVVCREYAHVWLKESWATYMEAVFAEDTMGLDALHMHLHEDKIAYQGEVAQRYARPIVTRHFESGWDMYDHHLYPGGAWRLHMLRHELGDEMFWTGVRNYLAKFDEKVVDTADFRKEMEGASGRNLNAFFDQWLYAPGYPKLKAEWEQSGPLGTLRIEQTQESKASGIGLFEFPVTVAIEHADGQWTRHEVRVKHRCAELQLPVQGDVQQIVVDPDCALLHSLDFHPGRDRLMRGLSGPHVQGRIHAAQALADKADPIGLQGIVDAWAGEAGWQVRRAWARFLGACSTTKAAQCLAQVLVIEQDHRVMTVLLASCEKHRDPVLAQALLDWLDQPGRPYRASAHALTALGKQRDAAPLDTLLQASFDTGWWGWVQRGAMAGLGESGQAAALPRLREALLDPSLRRSVRLVVAGAYASCARMQDRPLRERAVVDLADLSRHPDYGTRVAAARALAALGEPAGAVEIDATIKRVAAQDMPRVRKLAAGLRKQDPAADRKAMEAMETRMRKLEARLETLSAAVTTA